MKPVVPLAALLLAGTAVALGWRALHAPPAARPALPAARAVPSARPTDAPAGLPRVTRDLLRYEDARPSPLAPAPPAPPSAAPQPLSAAPAGPRLLGFVRQLGGLRAALLLPGNETVVTLSTGESEAGHTLLALDEEQGALLRLPDGSELRLPPPQ